MREPLADVLGGVHDLDGAALAAAVAVFPGLVLHGDLRPVQGVSFPQLLRVQLDREDVVREELPADELGVGLDGVPCVGGDDVPGQRVVLVQRDSSGANSGTSWSWRDQPPARRSRRRGDGSQQVRIMPSSPAAPRTALPSTATAGSQPGPAMGYATGPGSARRAR